MTKSGARDRVGDSGWRRDLACASGTTAVVSMPELGRRERSGTPLERSWELLGTILTLHRVPAAPFPLQVQCARSEPASAFSPSETTKVHVEWEVSGAMRFDICVHSPLAVQRVDVAI